MANGSRWRSTTVSAERTGVSTSKKPRSSKNRRSRRSSSARKRRFSQLAVGRKSSGVLRWLTIDPKAGSDPVRSTSLDGAERTRRTWQLDRAIGWLPTHRGQSGSKPRRPARDVNKCTKSVDTSPRAPRRQHLRADAPQAASLFLGIFVMAKVTGTACRRTLLLPDNPEFRRSPAIRRAPLPVHPHPL